MVLYMYVYLYAVQLLICVYIVYRLVCYLVYVMLCYVIGLLFISDIVNIYIVLYKLYLLLSIYHIISYQTVDIVIVIHNNCFYFVELFFFLALDTL